jgi:hypothetical protein
LHGWFYVHGPPQAPKGLPTGRRRFYDGSVSRAAAQRRSGARSASRATARRQVARILRGEPRRLCGVAYGARAPNGRSFAVGREAPRARQTSPARGESVLELRDGLASAATRQWDWICRAGQPASAGNGNK